MWSVNSRMYIYTLLSLGFLWAWKHLFFSMGYQKQSFCCYCLVFRCRSFISTRIFWSPFMGIIWPWNLLLRNTMLLILKNSMEFLRKLIYDILEYLEVCWLFWQSWLVLEIVYQASIPILIKFGDWSWARTIQTIVYIELYRLASLEVSPWFIEGINFRELI